MNNSVDSSINHQSVQNVSSLIEDYGLSKLQLLWTFQRLSQMQGGKLDNIRLQAGVEAIGRDRLPFQQLADLCGFLHKDEPQVLTVPDRVLLPMVGYHAQIGWGVVVDCTPNGDWVLQTRQGTSQVSEEALIRSCAVVQLGPKFNEGSDQLTQSEQQRPGFFTHVRYALKLYRTEIIEASIASGFIGLLALATSIFSMQVYDRVIPTRSEYTLIVLAVGVLLCILIELGMKYARSRVMDYVAVGMDNRLSREIFDRLLQVRVDQVPNSVGSLASQIRGYEQVRSFYTASTLFVLIDLPFTLLFIAIIAVIASPWVALVPCVFGLIATYIGLTIRQKIISHARESAALSNLKTGLLVEAVEGIETIKAGSGSWKFLSRWIGINSQTIMNDIKARGINESVGYLSSSIQQISYATLIVVGALVVMQGQMTQGALIASSILGGRILTPILAIPGLLVQYAHSKAALEGLEKLYQLKTDYDGLEAPLVPASIHGHYEIMDLKFSYGDNPPALILPKLSIRPGERIVVLGPIGAGKSSLLRVLSGLYQPIQGQVLLDGLELGHIHRQVINQKVAYLQQDHRLFHGTLRDNLLIGLPEPGDEILLEVMRRTGMDRFVANHPKGLSRVISEGGKGLSGGQKQLLAFTRLLLCQSTVYLLDEPTATMDDEQEKRCLHILAQEAEAGKTMVIVTHKPALLPLATRIIVIAGNKVVLDGSPDAILQHLQRGQTEAVIKSRSTDSSLKSTNEV